MFERSRHAGPSAARRPSLEHLRKQTKELLHGVRAGDPAAVELVRELHPRVADGVADPAALTLADAQLVVARQHGFPSWPRLREYLDVLARFSSAPHRQPVGGSIAGPGELADEFLRLACLTYGVTDGADDRRRPARARALLATVGFDVNLHTWATPLHLAAYEGHLEVVRLLVELGADPTARVVDFKPGDPLASVEDPTPLGWARHSDRHEVAAYLAGLDPARES